MIPKNIKEIMRKLLDNGFDAFIIGGANRDKKLGITPKDYDLFTNAQGKEILKIFPQGKVIGGEERQKKILTVMVDDVEVSQYRGNGDRTETGKDLLVHLSSCDLRINAIARDISGRVIDPHKGEEDIANKIVRAVGDAKKRIEEDKLRAFRAILNEKKLCFSLCPYLKKTIMATDITSLPIERIREEILKIILYKGGMEALTKLNLLTQVIPEFQPNIGLMGGSKHNEPVDEHMFNSQNEACKLTNKSILIWGISFHDVGKAHTKAGDGENTTFYDHETMGASMMKEIMERFKFSDADVKYVTTLISEHMFGPWKDNKVTKKGYIKHFKRLEDAGISIEDFVLMLYCDNQGNLQNSRKKYGDFIRDNELHKKYYELKHSKEPFKVTDLEISGKDLITMGMKPGKEIGAILDKVFEEIMEGKLKNERPTLMEFCRNEIRR